MIMSRGPAFFATRAIEWLSLVFWAAVALILILFLSCRYPDAPTGSDFSSGVIVRVEAGETFYGIVRDDGVKLVPQDLDVRFQQDGHRVRFTGQIDTESLAVWNWGLPIVISAIEFDEENWQTGTIRYIDLEGGFYGIISDDGTGYLPNRLADEFRVDGVRVRFTGTAAAEWVSVFQWGKEFIVYRMEKL